MTGNYYKLSNGDETKYVCEASLSKTISAMFSYIHTNVSVEKINADDYFDVKAQEWIDSNHPDFVDGIYTKSGLSVICVKFSPDEDDEATCHFVVVKDGKKMLMSVSQKRLIEGDI